MCHSLWYIAPTMFPAGSLEAEELCFQATGRHYTGCGVMHPRCCWPVAWKRRNSASRLPADIPVHYTTSCNTQSSAPEDGRIQRPKHVELIGIINKQLLLHLVGVYIIFRKF